MGSAAIEVSGLLHDRLLQVVAYLEDIVARSEPPVRMLNGERTVRGRDIPDDLPGCQLYPGQPWLSLVRIPDPPVVAVPATLDEFVHPVRHDPKHEPGLVPDWESQADDAGRWADEIAEEHEAWLDQVWRPWAARTIEARRVTKAFTNVRALALDLERQESDLELIWGHGLLSGLSPHGPIDYPLLATAVEIVVDPDTGVLEVRPTGPTRLETSALNGMNTQHLDDLLAMAGPGAVVGFDPLDDEARRHFLERALLSLEASPRVLSREDGPVNPQWRQGLWIDDTIAVTLRPRFSNLRGFIADLRTSAISGDALDFTGLGAMSALLHHEPSRIVDQSDPAESWTPSEQRLLMPLETNEDQEKIARELAAKKLVAVQGPPGTGKTHTIANLISHLVAHGKRVLVIAHKEEPLHEVRDKIPASLRDLSVALMGNSASQINQMQAAVRRLTAVGSPTEAPAAQRQVARIAAELDAAVAKRGRLEAALRALATRDRDTLEIDGVAMLPLQVGEWLGAHRAHSWLEDVLPVDAACPLSHSQADELLRITHSISTVDRRQALKHLPRRDGLPDATRLEHVHTELDRLRDVEQNLIERGLLRQARTSSAELLQSLRERTSTLAASLHQRPSWLVHLAASVANPTTAGSYTTQITALQGDLDSLAHQSAVVAGHAIAIDPGQSATPREHLLTLAKLQGVLASGGKAGLFSGNLKRAQRQNLIDGETLRTADDVDLVLAQVRIGQLRQSLALRWNQLAAQHNGPPLATAYPEHEVTAALAALRRCIDEETRIWPQLQRDLTPVVAAVPDLAIPEWLRFCGGVLADARVLPDLLQHEATVAELALHLDNGSSQPRTSPLWRRLHHALSTRHWVAWDEALAEAGRLARLTASATSARELVGILSAAAPRTAMAITAGADQPADADALFRAWRWRTTRGWLDAVIGTENAAVLGEATHKARVEIRELTEQLAEASARHALILGMTDRQRRALSDWATAIGKIGKGTNTKSAAHWTGVAQQKMQDAVEGVPVWIMSWQRALTQFRGGTTPFDVVIVDEASQCDIRSLLVLTLGRRAVVVGDDKQISPTSFVAVDFVRDLIDRHLKDVPSASFYEPSESLFNRAVSASNGALTLSEHFRCVPEIITFSSQRWYDGRIQPLRAGSGAFAEPFKVVYTPEGIRQSLSGYGTDVNQAEADALVDTVVRLSRDEDYQNKSFGVISLLSSSKQDIYLQHQLLQRLGEREYSRRQLKVGGAYAFQGAERDVMFVSLVADSNKRFGAFTKLDDQRRVNVAASRARDQVWIFHSAPITEFSKDDIRRAWLEYASSGFTADQQFENLEDLCESGFEKDVLRQLVERGYAPIPQFRIGKYRIDFVVQLRDGSRVAIECDGDQYHQDLDADAARRAILTRVGRCEFFSIRGSVYGSDPIGSLLPLWELLERRDAPRWLDAAKTDAAKTVVGQIIDVQDSAQPTEVRPAAATVDSAEPRESSPAEPHQAAPLALDLTSSRLAAETPPWACRPPRQP